MCCIGRATSALWARKPWKPALAAQAELDLHYRIIDLGYTVPKVPLSCALSPVQLTSGATASLGIAFSPVTLFSREQ